MRESSESHTENFRKPQLALPGVIVADSKGIIRSINDPVLRIFEWNKRDLLGKDIKMLMPEAVRAQHDQYIANFLRVGQGKVVGSTRVVVGQKSNGKPVKLRLALSFIGGDEPMFCALLEELVERSFSLTADAQGKILEVHGDPEPVVGMTAALLEGSNVTVRNLFCLLFACFVCLKKIFLVRY
jgi:PAS domain S-box-containing protein